MNLSTKILLAFVCGFLIAQIAKLIIYLVKNRKHWSWREAWHHLEKSGGMPSGHSASMFAATTYIGCALGAESALFAFALCVTAIIIYDATNVRYAVGEQGKLLNELAAKQQKKTSLRVVEGHTWPQVVVGALLGIIIGLGIFFLLG